ncbi:MAG TPA: M56 family metallopeptidase [Bryobacteraceae bacterium]|jgi:beta-lactamase regulating signal transducer with metallopeptidase domain|nr:M56 family metallopeptidase [Bryobacteraceae bacterium]
MILPYVARLICLCLAAFFLVHAALGLMVSLLSPWAVRFAVGRMAPVHGARLLLALRLLPSAFGLFVVIGLCTPSYLYLEPKGAPEEMGIACLAAAAMSVILWGWSIARATRAMARSVRHLRECRQRSRELRLPGERKAAWIIESKSPCVMLAGVFRPRMVISHDVVAALSAEQLAAAIRHERAHGISHDNFKRLLVLLAPGIVPFASGFRNLERGWARIAEWAADDRASAGKARRSLSLAAALVRVARLGAVAPPPALATSLMADGAELSERVDRLLRSAHRAAHPHRREPIQTAVAGLLVTVALIAVMAHPATLHSAHECLEFLIQ